ncbi:hypothetical protein KIW84_057606 [Lathyrus oleraceus]|uniref:Uncharacterized protein n=1 Tax=Pisum sativum TaxID=3888 RepID=A0A9D5AIF9_PEA|nr:hypothetical protein KIW84_057606 [Pisum sativum]
MIKHQEEKKHKHVEFQVNSQVQPYRQSYVALRRNHTFGLRVIIQGITVVPQALISWKGLLAYAATWEDQEAMKLACPNFDH